MGSSQDASQQGRYSPVKIKEKVAVVTGAGSGIGRSIARRLAREGAAVVVADVDRDAGRSAVREIHGEGGQAAFVKVDVTSETDVLGMVDFAEEEFGSLDVLVNNAGGVTKPYFPHSDPEQWWGAIELSLRGTMLGIHFGVRAMRKRGGGAIVNISSMGGVGFEPYDKPEYGAAKAGVMRLTASLATLKEQMGVRVNCICPGWVDTQASRESRAEMTPEERRKLVPPVLLQPEEIAEAVVMFVENDSMAGRVMTWQEGEPWRIVALGNAVK
jgi:NAD(P)-dependent dehydrogenase (short-subunit alcohol dehydrogenase family)